MSAHQWIPGQHLRWLGRDYKITHCLTSKRINLIDLESQEVCCVDASELLSALLTNRSLQFTLPPSKTSANPVNLSDPSPRLVHIALRRRDIITPLLERDSTMLTRAVLEKRIAEVRRTSSINVGLSVASLRRWIRAYRASGADLRSLIPRYDLRGGSGLTRTDTRVNELVTSAIDQFHRCREPSSMFDVYCVVAADIEAENQQRVTLNLEALAVPSVSTLYRHLRTMNVVETIVRTRSPRVAQRLTKQYLPGPRTTEPLQAVEIDHHRLDYIVVDEEDHLPLGRPTFTYALDRATRYPLGMFLSFEPPSFHVVAQCLRHAILSKKGIRERYGTQHDWQAHGIPARVVVDNGLEFQSDHFKDAMMQLGVIVEFCPVRTPEFKGGIERAFRTLNKGLIHTLPGTTFSDPVQRGDYDSRRLACLTLDQVESTIYKYMLDMYAERRHRGLRGIPARVWERALEEGFHPMLPQSAQVLDVLLGQVDDRAIWHYGIDWDNLRYQSPALSELRLRREGVKVRVKRSTGDLGRIYVFDDKQWLEIPVLSECQSYAEGLSLWKHRVIENFVRRYEDKMDISALGRAKRQIQEIVDEARQNHLNLGTRSRQARWNADSGKSNACIIAINDPGQNDLIMNLEPTIATRSAIILPSPTSEGWELVVNPRAARDESLPSPRSKP